MSILQLKTEELINENIDKKILEFKNRCQLEKCLIQEKFEKLYSFMSSDNFESVSEKQHELLEWQLAYMNSYNTILLLRIKDLSI